MNCHCCSGPVKRFGHFKNSNGTAQRYRCTRCGKCFSDSPVLDGWRIDRAKIVQIVKLLCEGVGVRACARLVDCDTGTVLNVLEIAGAKCESFLDRTLRNISVESLQIDEIWSKVRVCEERRPLFDNGSGDFYTFLGIDADTKLIVSHFTGKRTAESTDCFIEDVSKRIANHVQITTDGWQPYQDTLRHHFAGRLDYAVMQKNYGPDLYNQDKTNRRYSTSRCVSVTVKIKEGSPDRERINTSFVERVNLSVRHFNKRFARLGLDWSRKLENHRFAIALFVAAYNFCKVHTTLKTSPAQAAGLTDHAWTIEELIEAATQS